LTSSGWITQSGESDGKDDQNGGGVDDGAEGLVVVHSRVLNEASKDPTGPVLSHPGFRGTKTRART
jgi:hypothetical protein